MASSPGSLLVSGAVVHSLPMGATFDLEEAKLVHFVERHPDKDVGGASLRERNGAPGSPRSAPGPGGAARPAST